MRPIQKKVVRFVFLLLLKTEFWPFFAFDKNGELAVDKVQAGDVFTVDMARQVFPFDPPARPGEAVKITSKLTHEIFLEHHWI